MIRLKNYVTCIFLFLFSCTAFAQSYTDEIKSYREKYKQEFIDEENSPIKDKKDIQYIAFFDADESYKITADFTRTTDAEPFELPTMNGKTKRYIEYGTLFFKMNDTRCNLKVFQNIALLENPEYKNHLFLPFTDKTNGDETYGGGRYIDFQTSDIKNGTLVIDFNKAYNPYCAFAAGYSCPKPPEENNLPIPIRAGEKKYGKGIH